MNDFILENYIKPLEDEKNNIIGVYRQGSDILGYSDKYSDIDYSVVWLKAYPEKTIREKLLTNLNLEVSYIGDQGHKGTDKFIFNKIEHNISHRLDSNFFEIYKEVQTEKVNEPKLYILGGFKRGKIIYDPDAQLECYAEQLIVTHEIISMFKETRKNSTINNLKALNIAADRKQPVEYIKSLNYLLITFCIQFYLENKQFPMSPKWIEKDASKFGWNGQLLAVIRQLKKDLSFQEIFSSLNTLNKVLNSN